METEFILAASDPSILLVSPPFSSIAILTFNEANGNCPRAVPRSLKSYPLLQIDRSPPEIYQIPPAIEGQVRERRFSISDRGDSTRFVLSAPIFGAAPFTIFSTNKTQIVSSTIVPSTRITRLIRAVSRCKIVRDSFATIPRRIYIYIFCRTFSNLSFSTQRSIPYRIHERGEFDSLSINRRTAPRREGPQKPADMNTRLSLEGMENHFSFLLTSNVNSIPTGGIRIRSLGRCHVRGATKKQFLLNTARRTSSLNRRPHPEKIRETNEPLEPNPSNENRGKGIEIGFSLPFLRFVRTRDNDLIAISFICVRIVRILSPQ